MKKLLSLLGIVTIIGTGNMPLIFSANSVRSYLYDSNNHKQYQEFVDAYTASKRENRILTHSSFKPTGYFLKAGLTYRIYLNRELTAFEKEFHRVMLAYYQYGQYNDERITSYSIGDGYPVIEITGKIITVNTFGSGVLYIKDDNQTDLQVINVTANDPNDVVKIPVFQVNQTNHFDFVQEIYKTNSPFVEFRSRHYSAMMQTNMILKDVVPFLQHNFNDTLLMWDNVWKWSNEIYGLNENYSGINKKYSQYVHIANGDNDAGYANASHGRIMFHNQYGAGKDLFLNPITDQWGLWHETGHTYQTNQYTWKDLTEVTVNISSLYVQEKLGIPLRIFQSQVKTWLQMYFNTAIQHRDFNSLTGDSALWIKLAMFWQLHMSFGKNFYPLLSEKYREINQDPSSDNRFNTDEKKMQEFIKITSELTGYNLLSFFEEWGIRANWETRNIISKYKMLTKPIWHNIVVSDTERNPIIQEIL